MIWGFSDLTAATALVTSTEFVAADGSQSASPACEATTLTVPAPENVKFVPPLTAPGPDATAKVTGRPELDVAESPT